MPFELYEAPKHPQFGYNSPHLPLGTWPDAEDVPDVFEWDVPSEDVAEDAGDEHAFSETVEAEHEDDVAESDEEDASDEDGDATE